MAAQAGEIFGLTRLHVSTLMRNRAENFSVGRLTAFLVALGHRIEIKVRPTRKRFCNRIERQGRGHALG